MYFILFETIKGDSRRIQLCLGCAARTPETDCKQVTEPAVSCSWRLRNRRTCEPPFTSMWSQFIQSLPENGFNWSLLRKSCNYKYDPDQLKFCRVILNRVSPTTVTSDDEEIILVKILTSARVEAFLLTVNTWISLCSPCWKRDFLYRVMSEWIYEKNHLEDLLKSVDSCDLPQANQLTRTLTSLPDLVANCYKLSLPRQFTNDRYYTRLCVVMVSVCTAISEQLRSGVNGSTGVLSNLVGRIALLGHSHQLWSYYFKPLIVQSSNDLIIRRVVLSIMDRQSDIHLESLLTIILGNCDDSSQVDCLLSDAINRRDKVRYLLTEKFILISYSNSHQSSRNIIGYLMKHSQSSLVNVTESCLDIWSRRSSIENRTMQQILYIYSLILHAFEILPDKIIKEKRETWFQVIHRGLKVYLELTTSELRNCGLFVGKYLVNKLQVHSDKFDVPVDSDVNVSFLEKCLSNTSDKHQHADADADADAIDHDLIAHMNKDKRLIEELNSESIHHDKCVTKDNVTSGHEDDNHDDIDQMPLRQPKYLNDCIEGLNDTENAEWSLECLKCCRDLILKNPLNAKELARYITQTLLDLNLIIQTDEYINCRIDALVALCTVSPKEVSAYLIDRLYDNPLTMATKLDILRVLGMAAVQIAFGVHSTHLTLESRCVTDEVSENHRTVSMDTIEAIEATWNVNDTSQSPVSLGKSRKLTTATKVSIGKANPFTPYAGHFFYPLITRYNGRDVLLTLDSFDVHLTSNLIYTLGVILHASNNTWESRRMSRTLLPFIAPLRCHREPIVRKAVLFAFTNVLTCTPCVYLFEELIEFIQLFKTWLIHVTENDVNQSCRQSASKCIYILNYLIDQNRTS